MSRARKADKRGRSAGALQSFVQVERYIMQSVAWRSLSANARAAYLEVFFGYTGTNNGEILLSAQMLADRLNRDKSTAARALSELERLGFIECRSKGGFNCKIRHASEWRLTALKCDVSGELATKSFMRWMPQDSKHGGTRATVGGTCATDGTKATRNSPSQLRPCNREAPKAVPHGCTGATLLYFNHGSEPAKAGHRPSGAGAQTSGHQAQISETEMQPIGALIFKTLEHLDRSVPEHLKSWAPSPALSSQPRTAIAR
jgi:hypothetical protein